MCLIMLNFGDWMRGVIFNSACMKRHDDPNSMIFYHPMLNGSKKVFTQKFVGSFITFEYSERNASSLILRTLSSETFQKTK